MDAKFAEARADILQKTLKETAASAEEQSQKAAQLQKSLAAAKTNNPMHELGSIFSDPKMRDMIKAQQKAFIGPLIDKEYGTLFKAAQSDARPKRGAEGFAPEKNDGQHRHGFFHAQRQSGRVATRRPRQTSQSADRRN